MMNKSHIGWCDFSWNPITGCKKDCDFCYGKKQARRLCGTVRLNKSSSQIQWDKEQEIAVLPAPFHTESNSVLQFPAGFSPTFHPYRLKMIADKQKPANIYVCSMGEMFGSWIPLEWITAVFDACKAAPWHNYMFLTKNPSRYEELARNSILPVGDNFWYGTWISENTQAFVFGLVHISLHQDVSRAGVVLSGEAREEREEGEQEPKPTFTEDKLETLAEEKNCQAGYSDTL